VHSNLSADRVTKLASYEPTNSCSNLPAQYAANRSSDDHTKYGSKRSAIVVAKCKTICAAIEHTISDTYLTANSDANNSAHLTPQQQAIREPVDIAKRIANSPTFYSAILSTIKSTYFAAFGTNHRPHDTTYRSNL
jgi:hypothetical protein